MGHVLWESSGILIDLGKILENHLGLLTAVIASAAVLQWWETRKSTKRQLRAYVLVNTGSVYDVSKIGLKSVQPQTVLLPQWADWAGADLTLSNSGQTPGSHVVHWADMAIADAATEHLLVPPGALLESQASVIGPGTTITKSVLLRPFPLAEPVLSEIRSHKKGIYVFGKITYRDIFNHTHTTTYRLRYSGEWPPIPAGLFQFCLGGNDFD